MVRGGVVLVTAALSVILESCVSRPGEESVRQRRSVANNINVSETRKKLMNIVDLRNVTKSVMTSNIVSTILASEWSGG